MQLNQRHSADPRDWTAGMQNILIKGKESMNRAFDGDVVVVELLPQSQWAAPGNRLRRERAAGAAAAAAGAEEEDSDDDTTAHVVAVRPSHNNGV